MRRFSGLLVSALGLALGATAAAAQASYPSKPIRIIVPYAPGGLTDVVARHYAEQLRKDLGQQPVVENKPGASGIIAIETMARSRPDGYTLMIGNISTNGLTPVLLAKRMPIDYDKEVQIVARLADVPVFFLATTKDFPPKTFAEFIAYAKANPGVVRYGSAGATYVRSRSRRRNGSPPTPTFRPSRRSASPVCERRNGWPPLPRPACRERSSRRSTMPSSRHRRHLRCRRNSKRVEWLPRSRLPSTMPKPGCGKRWLLGGGTFPKQTSSSMNDLGFLGGSALKIGILLGDDIGLEVVPECIKVMKAAAARTGFTIDWQPLPIGKSGHEEHGNTLPAVTEQALRDLDGWVMGPIGHAAYPRGDAT